MANSGFIAQLAAVGALAPSADNSQSIGMHWNGAELAVTYADRRAPHGVFDANSHATLLSAGAVIENLQAALATNRLPADWQWGTGNEQAYASVAIVAPPEHFEAPPGPLRRHTNRLAYRADRLSEAVTSNVGKAGEGSCRLVILQDQPSKAKLVHMVRMCSEARFCNRALHEWLMACLRFTPAEAEAGDGLDVRCLGLPPGGQQFLRFISNWERLSTLNQIGLYKLLARMEVGLLSAAPALLCVVGGKDRRGTIDAGRLLTRAWTELNLQGVAAHPYYVVSDQINRLHDGTLAQGFNDNISQVEQEARQMLALRTDETLHMILRTGYPKAEAIRSRRLPLEAVFRDDSGA